MRRTNGRLLSVPEFRSLAQTVAARGVHTSSDLARFLLDTLQIATLPGSNFGAPPKELSLRLSTSYVDLETDAKATGMVALADDSLSDERLLREYHPGMNEVLARFRTLLASL